MAIFPGSAISSGGYDINNSLKFNSAGSDYLYWTPSSQGNRQKWTFSVWVKRSKLSTNDAGIFSANLGNELINFPAEDGFQAYINSGAGNLGTNTTNPSIAFRDVSAWYHMIVVWDTAQPIRTERFKLYANGIQIRPGQLINQVYPDQFALSGINDNIEHSIGRRNNPAGLYFNGYMAEINFIDGQALDPTYFGETDSTYGHWIPKEYTGTYGTNGFYLDFEGTFNNDKSGNGNHFTASGLTSADVTTDVPTLTSEDTCNYATLSSIDGYPGRIFTTDGNLTWNDTTGGSWGRSTIAVKTGKWYWEVDNFSTTNYLIGVSDGDESITNYYAYYSGAPTALVYLINGNKFIAGTSTSFISAFATSDVVGFALDADAGSLAVYQNGTLQGTITGLSYGSYSPMVAPSAVGSCTFNFGQKSFSQTPPTGFKKINAYNLDDPAVVPGDYFNAINYTGTGASSTSIAGLGFQPDFLWVKSRTNAERHIVVDAVRGSSKEFSTSDTGDDTNRTDFVTSLDSDGFTVGTGAPTNRDGDSLIAWAWKAGNTTTLNEDGAITSNTSVSTSAGISIATYRGTGSSTTVGHGLGVAPDFVIVKARNTSYGANAGDWIVWHKDFSATERIYLNYTLAKATGQTTTWNSTLPSSTVVSLGNNIHVNYSSTSDYVMYSFAEVDGFSKFGSYVGNANADGPFIYTGFRPRWILMKSSSNASTVWQIFDSAREQFNPFEQSLRSDSNVAEPYDTASPVDFLSNGFKLRGAGSSWNNYNTGTWIYAAFAEQPFKYANAMGTTFDKFAAPSESALTIGQSARYDGSASTLTRTPSAASNAKTWTWSGWVKLSGFGIVNLMAAKVNGLSYPNTDIAIQNNVIRVWSYTGSAGSPTNTFLINKYTTRVFRDPTAWYHIVVALDTTHPTAENRCAIYVNGERVTDFGTNTNPSQNRELDINKATQHTVGGSAAGSGGYLNGNLAEVNFVDGQALGPESFGYRDSTYGDWRPRSYSDFGPEVDYGPNGFRLDFQAGALGTDVSGNGNNWTLGSMSSTNDVVLDSPSNNFATLNPLIPNDIENPYDSTNSLSITEGGLKVSTTSVAHAFGTIPLTSGKWYWEGTMTAKSQTSDNYTIGIYDTSRWGLGWNSAASRNSGYVWYQSGTVWDYGTSITGLAGNTYTTGDIIGIALDLDNGKIYFAKNNTWLNSGDPAAGTGEVASGIDTTKQWLPVLGSDNNSITSSWGINFGQDSSFAGAETRQSNQDGNSIGDFYYTPPTGYLALCTSNLSAPSVAPKDYFNTVEYTGNGDATPNSNIITGVGFEPDAVWIKKTSSADDNIFQSRVLDYGASAWQGFLKTNTTDAELNNGGGDISGTNSDGFNISYANSRTNASGATYISWNWNAGDSVVVNTDGTLSANVCANTASGMSIITWSGTGNSSDNVGTGLSSSKPLKMAIVKRRDSTSEWQVGHVGIGTYAAAAPLNFAYHCELNDTTASSGSGPYFMGTQVNGDKLYLASGSLGSGSDWLAYVWQEVPGFSKFGSYTGNGSTDGPFIYTGFRPAWVMLKEISAATEHWFIYDSARNAYNLVENRSMPNLSNAADNLVDMGDFTSNGFKIRPNGTYIQQFNRSSATIIYAAFAEYPFKYANAR